MGEKYADHGETPGLVISEKGKFRIEDKDLVEESSSDESV